jgi:hypothetical protein
MNKKKAKVLIIGKEKLIKVTRQQESRLWFNRMPKRITNSVATITWYVFQWHRLKAHKFTPKSSPLLIRIWVWSYSFSIWAVTNSTSQSHWAWVKILISWWWSTTALIRIVWRAVWSGSTRSRNLITKAISMESWWARKANIKMPNKLQLKRDRAMRRNWDLISSKFRQHTTLMLINRSLS